MSDQEIDKGRRQFLITLSSIMGTVGLGFAAVPFLSAWAPSAKTQAAGAPVEVDVSKIPVGGMTVVQWRGKPVWIIHRDSDMLKTLTEQNDKLRDPECKVDQQPEYVEIPDRSIKPEFMVLIGICTHLGCSPTFRPKAGSVDPSWLGGFYCPCHGSKFDFSGRVFRGVPAPINLAVPPYRYLSDNIIQIGVNSKKS